MLGLLGASQSLHCKVYYPHQSPKPNILDSRIILSSVLVSPGIDKTRPPPAVEHRNGTTAHEHPAYRELCIINQHNTVLVQTATKDPHKPYILEMFGMYSFMVSMSSSAASQRNVQGPLQAAKPVERFNRRPLVRISTSMTT